MKYLDHTDINDESKKHGINHTCTQNKLRIFKVEILIDTDAIDEVLWKYVKWFLAEYPGKESLAMDIGMKLLFKNGFEYKKDSPLPEKRFHNEVLIPILKMKDWNIIKRDFIEVIFTKYTEKPENS